MVSYEVVKQSNARIASLPKGLVALFIGATSGIGQSALQQFAQHASAPKIYSVARPVSAANHDKMLSSLRESNPSGTYNLITADHSLISDIDKAVEVVKQKETKLDLLILSPGFIAFEGRKDTSEGLDPSMTTRYYSRQRAVEQLLPLLDRAVAPRIVSVLAGGMEGQINEGDLDLRDPANWSFWNSSVHSATMSTLALELFARANPRLSVAHWSPGPVDTPGLDRVQKSGMKISDPIMSQDEGGARALFVATSDRYAVQAGLVPVPAGLIAAKKTDGGIFILDPQGESIDNEQVLSDFRKRGVDKKIWDFTQKVFSDATAQA
ncbi:hypothetical protein BKA67DRAFT_656063 [Truncatella angustata]|uniref:Uncharacterized protein n=1 Tax=Truncatella angustata TaxID=152316 RepID=A0A9P8UT46_9PEZI|nr:uncharacterized protein BKA67DRAFT_656063 [Truncatella angustata]KAH6657821.1 hypothetical protein BKA67DRAFT_656063 [Truncatella angustata]